MKRLANVVGASESLIWVATVAAVVGLAASGEASAGIGDLGIAVMLGVTATVGWLIASRMPRHPIGWLLLAIAGFFLLAAALFGIAYFFREPLPGVAAWLFWYVGTSEQGWVWLPPVGLLFTQVPLLFPDGRLPTARWRWFSAFTIASLVVGSAVLATVPGEVYPGLDNPMAITMSDGATSVAIGAVAGCLLISFVGSAASVVVRYRRAALTERTQIRWFAWAVSVVIAIYVGSFFLPGEGFDSVVAFAYGLIPASIGVAVLRYHLYDIDRVVSRTTSYAIVTTSLLLIYGALVTTFSRVVPSSSSSVAVAAATLTAAAAFRPLLSRVQRRVERRFNRSRYDALRTAEEFADRLRRDGAQEVVASDLLAVVGRAFEPSRAGLWLAK
ncbi:MAG: hypothetical protein ABI720_01805 [Actinomycetes bacterium]